MRKVPRGTPTGQTSAPSSPRRPSDFSYDVSLRVLLDAFFDFLGKVINANHGIGDPQPTTAVASAALAGLAAQHALADRVLAGRWVNARDALVYGATLADVAEAMGLDPDEVTVGLASWADGQHRHDLMTGAQRDEVLALLARAS